MAIPNKSSAKIGIETAFVAAGLLVLTSPARASENGERIGDAWSDPRNPIVRIFGGERLDLWSLKPVRQPALPEAESRGDNPIDAFIRLRLSERRLLPSPEADKRTLGRRLYFGLTGLPPTPEEMSAFLADASPMAYERLVERLLASPRYGEHWARQWLDVVRYSDSNGFDWDEYRKKAWRFRDYVVRSLNGDKPFDRFVREQLAGDELLAGPPQSASERDALIATGYLRLGPQDNSASLFDEQDRARAEWMADLTETTGSAFLGLTLSCCRCHDHKYDPISQADHFRLRAFFAPLQYADDLPLDFASRQAEIRKHNNVIEAKQTSLQEAREALRQEVRARLLAERTAALEAEGRALSARSADNLTKAERATRKTIRERLNPTEEQVDEAFSETERARKEAIEKQIAELETSKRAYEIGLLATDKKGEVEATRILFQGNHQAPREAVSPGFLSVLDPNPATMGEPLNPSTTGRRLALADWIASEENPLTGRVLVNRVWLGHFGRGLVGTPNDFGLAGDRPTHPELLDWLASEFMAGGWSLKNLHRLIVTSATYRQTSSPKKAIIERAGRVDGGNAFYWRQNLRRLTAEQLRDAVLHVSGTLTTKWRGEPVWPDLPAEVLQANPAFLDDNAEKTKGWYPSPLEERSARSLFLVQKRTVKVPFLEAFDLPSNETSCARREESTVPPQAFSLLNNALVVEASEVFADRIGSSGVRGADFVRKAYARALQREPTPEELSACLSFLETHGPAALCRGLFNLNEFVFLD